MSAGIICAGWDEVEGGQVCWLVHCNCLVVVVEKGEGYCGVLVVVWCEGGGFGGRRVVVELMLERMIMLRWL